MNKILVVITTLIFCLNGHAQNKGNRRNITVVGPNEFVTINGVSHRGDFEVNGGTLRIENSAVVNGDITVSQGGNLDILSQSVVAGNINSNNAAGILIERSEVRGKSIFISTIGRAQLNESVFNSDIFIYDQNVNSDSSDFAGRVIVTGGDTIVFYNSVIADTLSISNARITLVNLAEEISNVILVNNQDAILNESNITNSISVNENVRARVFSNNVLNDKKMAKIEDNENTEVTGNYFSGNLKIKKGVGTCEESNNSYLKLFGGCN